MMMMVMWMMKIRKQQQEKEKVASTIEMMMMTMTGSLAVPDRVLYTRCTHGEATVTAAAPSEREDKDEVVVLPFIWFPSGNILFIAADIQY